MSLSQTECEPFMDDPKLEKLSPGRNGENVFFADITACKQQQLPKYVSANLVFTI